MRRDYPSGSGTVASVKGHPLHPMLIPFPIAFLTSALLTDITFLSSDDSFWARASFLLLAAGLITGLVAGLTGFWEMLGVRRARNLRIAWLHGGGNVVALAITAVNLWVRWDDPAGATVHVAIILSVIVVGILGVTGWLGGEMSFHHGIGVAPSVGASRAPPESP